MNRRRRTLIPIVTLTFALAGCAAGAPEPAPSLVSADGERRVAIAFESGPPAFLRLDETGTLVGWAQITDRSVFVLVPDGARYRIRTGWVDTSGNTACLGVRRNENGPATVVAAVCRSGAQGQRFTFTRTGGHDSQGRRTYRIGTNAGTLVFNSRDGLHVEPRDDLDATGFAVIDR